MHGRWRVCVGGRRAYHSRLGVFGYRPELRSAQKAGAEHAAGTERPADWRVERLVAAYRRHGHLLATVDPVHFKGERSAVPELSPERYGLSLSERVELAGAVSTPASIPPPPPSGTESVRGLVDLLRQLYCGNISYEYFYLESEAERAWFARRVESESDRLSGEQRAALAAELVRSQAWDSFLATKYPAVKRYGGEGVDTLLTCVSTLLHSAGAAGVTHVVVGMPHRGRLNLQTVLLGLPPVQIFSKYAGRPEFPPSAKVMGDIAQHFSVSADLRVGGNAVHVSLLNNPSHLEVVNPVSMGKTRSKQLQLAEGDYSADPSSRCADRVVNLQVHGDAALPGQGVNQECLMMARVPHYDVGGSVHLVVNNQVGFTTPADRGRSTRYATDVAKMIAAPVIHVNAEHPEEVVRATRIAFEYQRRFRKDVFVDLNGFRKYGHNEVDDPTFTNPALYKIVHSKQSIPDQYTSRLQKEGVMSEEQVQTIFSDFTKYLQAQQDLVPSYQPEASYLGAQWSGMAQAPSAVESWDTGVPADTLAAVGRASVRTPEGFTVHPHLLKTHVKNRLRKVQEGTNIDWATAEAMAFGSLLLEGRHVRLSGEDVGRGTFSQRHAMLVDNHTNDIFIPLNYIHPQQKTFIEVANSILSEEAVLGFEYGMSIDHPDRLVIWEAQFGDFFNTAQTVIDTYIASGETKWMTSSGLVLLLPHGYDGAASDHSSCRPERFLQLTDSLEAAPDGDDVNLHVVAPTTPAQYFHLLRRQVVRNYRKPLVVISPKTMLRLSAATSPLADFLPGTHFKSVLGDAHADPARVRRVIFTSGKHYHALAELRAREGPDDVALVRLEGLCPFPVHELRQELDRYKQARTFIWSQEEPRNMGAWSFVQPRFNNLLATKLRYSGRSEGATVAEGVSAWHKREAERVVRDPLLLLK